jgi:hypothetical protein
MLNIKGYLIGINIIGLNLKDLSLGLYSITLECDINYTYKSVHLGFLLFEMQVLIPIS